MTRQREIFTNQRTELSGDLVEEIVNLFNGVAIRLGGEFFFLNVFYADCHSRFFLS